jgi:hypothetical protein
MQSRREHSVSLYMEHYYWFLAWDFPDGHHRCFPGCFICVSLELKTDYVFLFCI